MKVKQYLLASAICLVPLAANAASLPVKAPMYKAPAVVPFTWTGFYLGASAGIISQGTKAEVQPVGIPIILESPGISGVGFIGGADIGYNWQIDPNWVIGLEADISGSSLDDTSQMLDTFSLSSRLNALGTVRARFGYAFGRALLYATAGWAYGHVKNTDYLPPQAPPWFNFSSDKWRSGWTAGGGLEYAITPNPNTWTVRVEALYVDLGTNSYDVTHPPCGSCRFAFKNHYVIGRVGLNYKF